MSRYHAAPFAVAFSFCMVCFLDPAAGQEAEKDLRPEQVARIKEIFRSRCESCHAQDASTTDFAILDVASLLRSKVVLPNQSDRSRLIETLVSQDESIRMPQDQPPLAADEIELIRLWIDRGAQAFPEDVKPASETEREKSFAEVIGVEFVLKQILAHQRSLRPSEQPFYRYFSCNHLLTQGATQSELQLQRDALVKTLHHLTYERDPVAVTPVNGSNATIFAVDIRRLGWHKGVLQASSTTSDSSKTAKSDLNIYDLVLLEYPYGITYDDSELFERLMGEYLTPARMVRNIPYLRIDWFCTNTLSPTLYHDMMRMPRTVHELEARIIDVDVDAQLRAHSVSRGAVAISGVSKNNRAAERYTTKQGSYWKSIDYASNRGAENIFRDPVDLHGVGGEMIFTLPNGMQGYYLASAIGTRLDVGPTEIVSDKFADDKAVRNGLSCVRCHDQGIKRFKDVVRNSLEQLPSNLGFSKRDALALYPPQDQLNALLREDGDRFMVSLEKILGHPQVEEPLIPVSRRFAESPISLLTAAGELGLAEPSDLASIFRSRSFAALGLLPLASRGVVRRDAWEDSYDQIVREMGLGTPVVSLDSLNRLEYAPLGLGPDVLITTTRGSRFFAPGDELQIVLENRGHQAIFVELIGTGTNGEKVQLLPSSTQLSASSKLLFPEHSKLKIQPNLGAEQITIYASESQFEDGILYRGEDVADRIVHTDNPSSPIVKKTLLIETR